MNISVIGSGYVGLITGAGFAKLGHKVICVDVVKEKVDAINAGKPHLYEEGLPQLLKEVVPKHLSATTDLARAIKETELTFIGVGTPPQKDGNPDLTFIRQAAASIGEALKQKTGYHVVVVKSTVTPGTSEDVVGRLIEQHSGKKANRDFGLAMSPEFLREGKAIDDFFNPVRVVIGSRDERAVKVLQDLYKPLHARVIVTEPKVAELIKYASNAFLATKISFANEVGNLCKALGIDVYEVMEGVGLDPRIGRAFLDAGPGYGGSCLPKDLNALRGVAGRSKVQTILLDAVKKVNDEQPILMVRLAEKHLGSLKGKTIGLMGVAFKPGTDDIRESQAIPICAELLLKGAKVVAHDPEAAANMQKLFPQVQFLNSPEAVVAGSSAVLIVTGWPEHASPELYRNAVVIDGRHLIPKDACKIYEGLGW